VIKIEKSVEAGVALWILVHALIQIVLLQSMFTCERKHGLECFLLLLIFFSFEDPKCFSNCYRIISNESRSMTAHQVKGKNLPGNEVDFQ